MGARKVINFLKGLKLCVTKDGSRSTINGVYYNGVSDNPLFAATDGHVLAIAQHTAANTVISELATEIGVHFDDITSLGCGMFYSDTVMRKGAGVASYFIKDTECKYPNLKKVIPVEYANKPENLPFFSCEITALCHKIMLLTDGYSKHTVLPIAWNGQNEIALISNQHDFMLFAMPIRVSEHLHDNKGPVKIPEFDWLTKNVEVSK